MHIDEAMLSRVNTVGKIGDVKGIGRKQMQGLKIIRVDTGKRFAVRRNWNDSERSRSQNISVEEAKCHNKILKKSNIAWLMFVSKGVCWQMSK